MSCNDQPIALFDSGVGGLSVLRHVRELLPAEDLIYLADSAHTPYGDKGEEAIIERALIVGRFLTGLGAKAIVVACNTATAAAVAAMREALPVPIVGMEPGVKPAVAQSRNKRVGVLATAGTVASEKFSRLCATHAGGAELHIQACPGLVEQIEALELDSERTRALLLRYLEPLRREGVDTLALGCTHYPFLIPAIRRLLGEEVALIDTGAAVARQLQRILEEAGTLRLGAPAGTTRFYASRVEAAVARQIEQLWGEVITLLAME